MSDFVVDLIGAAEWRMNAHATDFAALSYPRERVALLKVCREQIEAMIEWKDHAGRTAALHDGLAAIAAIRATAEAAGERISVIVNGNIVRQLRDCLKYLIEYEVLREKDALSGKRGRR